MQVLLGSWERGQEYTNDIIENLNHWSTGWTDWNLVLDMNGGDFCNNDENDDDDDKTTTMTIMTMKTMMTMMT